MKRLFLLYPSIRPREIDGVLHRARIAAAMPLRWFIAWNGPQDYRPECTKPAVGYDCSVQHLGERPLSSNLVPATNEAMRRATAIETFGDHDVFGFWSDDFEPHHGWATAILDAAEASPNADYFAARDDCFDHAVDSLDYSACVPFARWRWIRDANGGEFWPSCYRRWACDNDNWMRAKLAGKALYVDTCHITHRNPTETAQHQRPRDEADHYGLACLEADRAVWARRRAEILAGNLIWRPQT